MPIAYGVDKATQLAAAHESSGQDASLRAVSVVCDDAMPDYFLLRTTTDASLHRVATTPHVVSEM